MNHSGAGHLKGMVVIAGAVFVVLLLLGKAPGDALSLAAVVACPLMMVGMMFGGHRGHDSHGGHDVQHGNGSLEPGAPRPGGQGSSGSVTTTAPVETRREGTACH